MHTLLPYFKTVFGLLHPLLLWEGVVWRVSVFSIETLELFVV